MIMENEVTEGKKQLLREYFRKYLRVTELCAVVVLVIVGISYFMFRSSAPITVTNDTHGITGESSTTPIPAVKPVETEHFIVTNMDKVEGSAKENIATANPKIFKAPTNFKTFSYDATLGKRISLVGTCKDAYYALLIFKSSDDYRKDPARSYYNTAYACPASGIITLEVDLQSINLTSGSYYLFLADQGEKGSWYNPR